MRLSNFNPSNDLYTFKLYKLKPNSSYEYEESPTLTFKGSIMSDWDKEKYKLISGVNLSQSSIYIRCDNLPQEVKDGDRVFFLEKFWTIESVGYVIRDLGLINPSIFSVDYIISKCPKALTLI